MTKTEKNDRIISKDCYIISAYLGGTKLKRFRTVWQKDTKDSIPRIITAYREDE